MFHLYRDLNRKSNQVKNCKAKIELLGSYDPQKQVIIEDPYYVSMDLHPICLCRTAELCLLSLHPAMLDHSRLSVLSYPFCSFPYPCPSRGMTLTLRLSTSSV